MKKYLKKNILIAVTILCVFITIISGNMIEDYNEFVLLTNFSFIILLNFLLYLIQSSDLTYYNRFYNKFLLNQKKNLLFKNSAYMFINIALLTVMLIIFLLSMKISINEFILLETLNIVAGIYIYVFFTFIFNYMKMKKLQLILYLCIPLLISPYLNDTMINFLVKWDNVIIVIFLLLTFLIMIMKIYFITNTKLINKTLLIEKLKIKHQDELIINIENLHINKGIYLLKASNGSGKSTFLQLLAGITSDELTVNYSKYSIPSECIYFSENSYELNSLTEKELLYKVCVGNKLSFPSNYETIYKNKKLNDYSKGEKKIVILKIILFMQPKVLLLDEPFEALDEKNNKILCELINQRNENSFTTIITTHVDAVDTNFNNKIFIKNKELIINGITIDKSEQSMGIK
jgi:ABC-2 type transport system ATP-binding protein